MGIPRLPSERRFLWAPDGRSFEVRGEVSVGFSGFGFRDGNVGVRVQGCEFRIEILGFGV